jgi:hypothetical protein
MQVKCQKGENEYLKSIQKPQNYVEWSEVKIEIHWKPFNVIEDYVNIQLV